MLFQSRRDTKNKWVARIFEEWGKARFSKVATLEPGGLFKEYDLHKVQSLEIPLLQMDTLSVNYWLTKFVEEVAKPSKERYPPKTLYLLSFVVNKVMFFYLANMQIKKICIRVSGQVDEFRNPVKTELKTRPCLKAVFSTRFSLDF